MKRSTYFMIARAFVLVLFLNLSALLNASAAVKTEDRAVSGFHGIAIGGSFEVELSQGSTESLKVEAEEEIMTNIITEVKDGSLKISYKGKGWHSKSIKIFISFKDLDNISCSGSNELKGKGLLKFSKLDLDLSGSADIDLQLEASTLKADMSGSSNTKLSGTVTNMDVEISGAGNLEASELTSQVFELEISGSGDAKVNVSKELKVQISGSGDVVYKGDPNIKKSISGSGSIKKIG